MNKKLAGSNLTYAMLKGGSNQVWCAVSNDSDEQAIATFENADYSFLKHIVSFNNSSFLCKDGTPWQYAVPVKKVEITQEEVGF